MTDSSTKPDQRVIQLRIFPKKFLDARNRRDVEEVVKSGIIPTSILKKKTVHHTYFHGILSWFRDWKETRVIWYLRIFPNIDHVAYSYFKTEPVGKEVSRTKDSKPKRRGRGFFFAREKREWGKYLCFRIFTHRRLGQEAKDQASLQIRALFICSIFLKPRPPMVFGLQLLLQAVGVQKWSFGELLA